jgi:hypothetical protein
MLTDANEVSHLVSFDLVEWISLPGGMAELLRERKRYRAENAVSSYQWIQLKCVSPATFVSNIFLSATILLLLISVCTENIRVAETKMKMLKSKFCSYS